MRFLSVLLLVMAALPKVYGQVLLNEGFDNGTAIGWKFVGKGDYLVTNYQGNYSLRLTQQMTALYSQSIVAKQTLNVSAAVTANDLEEGELCLAELSLGQSGEWLPIVTLSHIENNAVQMHSGRRAIQVEKGDELLIRLSVIGKNNYNKNTLARRPDFDYCWFDDVLLSLN